MDQIRVSVIIPVYNASLYIRQCLDSVTGQSLKDIEIICVDDGSTDDSLDILREYQNADPRLKVMSQKNSFAGAARNNGMSQAEGKYLVFWDSDDFFNETALEKLYAKCEEDQAEAAVCGAQRFSDDTQKAVHFEGYLRRAMLPEKTPFAFEDIKDYIFNFTCEAAWNKMFLRSFIEEQGLRFHETRNGNDLYFTMMALTQAKKITVVPEDLVFYRRQQKNSLVSSIDKSALSVFKEWILLKQDLEKKNIDCERSFHNKIISVIRYNLQLSTSAKAFNEKYEWLQTEGIEAFGLEKKEEGYFFNKEKEEFLSVLLEENADDCLIWLNNRNFWNIFSQQTMLEEQKSKNREKQEKINTLRAKLEETKEKLQISRDKVESLRNRLEKKQEKLEITQDKYNNAREELEKIKSSLPYKMVKGIKSVPDLIRK